MSKNVIALNSENIIIEIKSVKSDYVLNPGEIEINEYNSSFIGAKYVNGSIIPQPPKQSFKITKRSFFNRLLPEEEIAIDLASYGQTVEAATVRRFMRRVNESPYVDLDLQETKDGLAFMEQVGYLGQGRANIILTTPIAEDERFES